MRSLVQPQTAVRLQLSRNGIVLTNPINTRLVGNSEVVLLIAEEQAVCSGRPKRKRDTFLPLLEHAIAYLHEFRVRFNVGLQIL